MLLKDAPKYEIEPCQSARTELKLVKISYISDIPPRLERNSKFYFLKCCTQKYRWKNHVFMSAHPQYRIPSTELFYNDCTSSSALLSNYTVV